MAEGNDLNEYISEQQKTSLTQKVPERIEPHVDIAIGLFNSSGTQLLESPQPELISSILENNEDGRIEYFRFRKMAPVTKQSITDSGELVTWEGLEPSGIDHSPTVTIPIEDGFSEGYGISDGGVVFANVAVIPELEKEISKSFADREEVGIRGIAVSLKDGITVHGTHINTIPEILQSGGAGGTDVQAQTLFVPNKHPEIGHRSIQWLMDHPQNIRRKAIEEGNRDAASNIFPAILVYDRSKFSPNSVELPESTEERSKVILKAYILDYPIP